MVGSAECRIKIKLVGIELRKGIILREAGCSAYEKYEAYDIPFQHVECAIDHRCIPIAAAKLSHFFEVADRYY
jgi:hypothetical protein